jgi:uncharacterized protein with gpF-like domain
LIDEMMRSVEYWLGAAYRANEPEMALDKSPARILADRVRALRRRWERNFSRLSADLARYFARATAHRSDLALKRALSRGGMSVEFKLTPAMNDVLQATVHENVSLIRSIPEQFFTQIEGDVMRSVAVGGDLHSLSGALRKQYGVTKRRAALIARDQNNKATANLTRVRYIELGIERMRWLHSGGGKEPRPSHVKAGRDREVFDLREGWYDPHEREHILPGQLVNCRCSMVPILENVV